MTYAFKQLHAGNPPHFVTLLGNLPRLSAGVAYAYDYFGIHGYEVIQEDFDSENNAVDMMTTKGNDMFQFAVEGNKQ